MATPFSSTFSDPSVVGPARLPARRATINDAVGSGAFNALNLLSTVNCSDIFVAQTPHKVKGMGGFSGLVEFLRSNKADLPKLTIFENEDPTLKKITHTELKVALQKSDLYAFRQQL